jgi:hypothetical protein
MTAIPAEAEDCEQSLSQKTKTTIVIIIINDKKKGTDPGKGSSA